MKLKIYGATGSFPRCMSADEMVDKIYHYQKLVNHYGGFEKLLSAAQLKNKTDKNGNLSKEDFTELLHNNELFEFWIGNTYGGNTSCIYIETSDGKHISLDAGAGFIPLSRDLMKLPDFGKNQDELYILLSHFHWDHIQGIPFSALIFTQNKMKFIGMPVTAEINLQHIIESQMNKYNFPIPLDFINKNITFYEIEKTAMIGKNTLIAVYPMEHPLIGSYTYKITDTQTGKSMVYATDFEQPTDKLEEKLIGICKGSDILVIDAHFSPGESTNFQGWGHGNFGNAVDLARLAGIKDLILFHHNFNKTDKELFKTENDVKGYLEVSRDSFPGFNLNVHFAREGLEINF